MTVRNRNWCFTLNNYTTEEYDAVLCLESRYLVVGRETGEVEATPHLQGYLVFKNEKSLTQMKQLIPRAHFEVAKGSAQQNFEYCSKQGDYKEIGTRPLSQKQKGQTEKDRWSNILKAAEEGDMDWIKEHEPQVYVLHDKALERAFKRAKPSPQNLDTLEHEWWYGPTGTGKSRSARELYPDAYIKDPKERWWDGYADQSVVIIDDFDKYQKEQGGDMKRWLDHYPFKAPVKGGYLDIRPAKIIVTSNYHPGEIWDDEQTVDPIMRRVKCVDYDKKPKFLINPNFIKPN